MSAVVVDRKRFIGGSDVAAIMGVSEWATPVDTYYRKIGEPDKARIDPMRERIFKRGKRLEPVVIEMLRDELGIDVTKVSPPENPNRYQDAEFPFMAAEIDFEWRVRPEDIAYFPWAKDLEVGSIQNGEIKTAAPFKASLEKWGQMDTDEVPIDYAFQSMHGLAVTPPRKVCMYGVLFGADNLVTYAIRRDEEVIASIRQRVFDFWHNHVLARVPPEPLKLHDVVRIYQRPSLPTKLADPAVIAHLLQLRSTLDEKDVLKEREEYLRFQLANYMREAEALVDEHGRTLATWKASTYSDLNEAALKAKYPAIHAEFYETRPTRRFDLKGRKGR